MIVVLGFGFCDEWDGEWCVLKPDLMFRRRDEDERFGFGDTEHERFDFVLRSSEHDRGEVDTKHTGKFAICQSHSCNSANRWKRNLRVFGDDLGGVNHLHVDDYTLEEVLQHSRSVLRRSRFPKRCEPSGRVVRYPNSKLSRTKHRIRLTVDVRNGKRRFRRCIV